MRLLRITLTVILLMLIILELLPNVLEIPFVILLGWIPAAKRLGGNLPFSGEELGLFFGGSLLLVLGVHWFLQQSKPWRVRWTLTLSGGVALAMLATMSVVGVVHQLGWIVISREPVFARRSQWIRDQLDLVNTATAIAHISDLEKSSPAVLCNGLLPKSRDGIPPWEKYHILFVQPTNGYFAVIWPRDQTLHGRIGSACVYLNGDVKLKKKAEL